MSWGAKTEQEWFIYCYLKKNNEHVSYERLLSGHGLENLYQALGAFHQQEKVYAPASEIITLALAQECTIAQATVAQFFVNSRLLCRGLGINFCSFWRDLYCWWYCAATHFIAGA